MNRMSDRMSPLSCMSDVRILVGRTCLQSYQGWARAGQVQVCAALWYPGDSAGRDTFPSKRFSSVGTAVLWELFVGMIVSGRSVKSGGDLFRSRAEWSRFNTYLQECEELGIQRASGEVDVRYKVS